ncbi:PREDICTED: uncharacterized protein LOC104611983 [Nelumbo nucifera]|uniref:Uncharacterized protein LOC104611983 n=1 Tax=Nelumbo nucifera TaxID=4432 RepID=A0A1U8BK84_NELNU|nr:PREDICTED: uncharacterized protein LOC104611983 [Nelumbo nucifera]
MDPTSRLSKFQGDPLSDPTQYRNIVGVLQYVALARPDVAFVVNKACQFLPKPTNDHWTMLIGLIALMTVGLLAATSLLRDFGIRQSVLPILYCDNIGATYLAAHPMFHACTKHIEVEFHFLRDHILRKNLDVRYISTDDQLADIFTKPLAPVRFGFLRSKLHVLSAQFRLRGRILESSPEENSTRLAITNGGSQSRITTTNKGSLAAAN